MISSIIFLISFFFSATVITPLFGYVIKLDTSSPMTLLSSLLDNPSYLAIALMISLVIALIITITLTRIYKKATQMR